MEYIMSLVTTSATRFSPSTQAYLALAELTLPEPSYRIQHVTSVQQLRQLWEIDAIAYEECSLPFETFRSWWEHYPVGNTIIMQEDEIIASVGLWPLSSKMSADFIAGQIKESDLIPVSLDECEECSQRFWYASGIVLKPELRNTTKQNPLKPLLKAALSLWVDSERVAYPTQLLALCYSQEGQRMLERFNFLKIRDGSQMPDTCDLYSFQAGSDREIHSLLRSRNL